VAVVAGFDRARASACTVAPDGRIEVVVRPETTPVNNSAWYAFRVVTEAGGTIELTLSYEDGTHRYSPKISRDGLSWTTLDPAGLAVAPDRRRAAVSLELEPGATLVAAQPLETAAQALARWDAAVARGQLLRQTFGASVRGVPLVALATPDTGQQHTLVLVARQHPPETTGAAAFDAFLARLLEEDALAVAFRGRAGLLILPVMNPDGLAAGHWRTNANGVDLNRDWGIWNEAETRAAGTLIEAAHAAAPLLGLIDFHSTRRDVLYAMPAEDPLYPDGLAEDWFGRWQAAAGEASPPVQRSFDDDQMNSKTWSRLRFGLSAVTYEVGDDTPPDAARANARIAAETYMQAVMARTPDQLLPPSPQPAPSL
jgi:cytosolic carboxypeptidase protein 6